MPSGRPKYAELSRVMWTSYGGLALGQGTYSRQGSEIQVFLWFMVANEGCNMALDVAKDSRPWCPCMAGRAQGGACELTVGNDRQ